MNPVTLLRTGKRGRPAKIISEDLLRDTFAPHRNISVPKLGKVIRLNRNTINKARKALGIRREFSQWTDEELDRVVEEIRKEKPSVGLKFICARLRSKGVKMQRERVRKSMRRNDPIGVELRGRKAIRRRNYVVAGPDALWHMDGYHKLILWGIVIHGLIDGYCRTVRLI